MWRFTSAALLSSYWPWSSSCSWNWGVGERQHRFRSSESSRCQAGSVYARGHSHQRTLLAVRPACTQQTDLKLIHARTAPATGPLLLLFPQPGALSPPTATGHSQLLGVIQPPSLRRGIPFIGHPPSLFQGSTPDGTRTLHFTSLFYCPPLPSKPGSPVSPRSLLSPPTQGRRPP